MTQTHTKKKELEKNIYIYKNTIIIYIPYISKIMYFCSSMTNLKKKKYFFVLTHHVCGFTIFLLIWQKKFKKKKSPLKQKKACPYASYTECYGWKTFKFFAWLKFFLRILKPNLCRNTPFHPPKKEVKKWSLFVCFLWSPAHFLHMNCM